MEQFERMSAISGNSGGNYWISVSGLRDASLRMDSVAHNVANANTDGFRPDRIDAQAEANGGVRSLVVDANAAIVQDPQAPSQTDYGTEGVNLILARRAFNANLKALQSQHQADQAIIDIVG